MTFTVLLGIQGHRPALQDLLAKGQFILSRLLTCEHLGTTTPGEHVCQSPEASRYSIVHTSLALLSFEIASIRFRVHNVLYL